MVEQIDAEDTNVVGVLRRDARRQLVVGALLRRRDGGEARGEGAALLLDRLLVGGHEAREELPQRVLDATARVGGGGGARDGL